jgi:hypothetical protein
VAAVISRAIDMDLSATPSRLIDAIGT